MTKELWATYSVIDHLRPRELALDVLIFDRLVFPVPEKSRIDGDQTRPGPVSWKTDSEAFKYWERQKWNPSYQQEVLEILKPVLRKVYWGPESAQSPSFKEESARLADQSLPDYAFKATRTELTRDLPALVDGVAAMGPAFRTYPEAEAALGLRDVGKPQALPGGELPTILGWRFVAPDLTQEGIDDLRLLEETVTFVDKGNDFRSKRTAFIEFQSDFLRSGQTDAESIKQAISKMSDLMTDAKTAAERMTLRTVACEICQVVPVVAGLGIALAAGAGVPVAATAAAFWFANVAVNRWVLPEPQRNNSPAAFIYDARQHFARMRVNAV